MKDNHVANREVKEGLGNDQQGMTLTWRDSAKSKDTPQESADYLENDGRMTFCLNMMWNKPNVASLDDLLSMCEAMRSKNVSRCEATMHPIFLK